MPNIFMKVLHITNYGEPHGGVYRHINELINESKKEKPEIIMKWVSIKESNKADFSLNANYSDLIFFQNKIITKLDHIIKEYRPDVIHLHDISLLYYEIFEYIKKNKLSSIMTLHNLLLVCPNGYYIKNNCICNEKYSNRCIYCIRRKSDIFHFLNIQKIFKNDLKNVVKKYISTSYFFEKIYKKNGFKNIETILNFISAPKKVNKKNKKYLLYVGRLDYEKGPDIAIELIKRTNLDLVIIGKGPYKKNIEKLISKYNLSKRVKILGFVKDKTLNKYYSECTIFIHPTRWVEASSLVLYEAMIRGKTCLVANRGEVNRIIKNGKNGFLFNIDNLDFTAKKLMSIIENENLEKIGENARKYAKKEFNFRKYYKKLIKIYYETRDKK